MEQLLLDLYRLKECNFSQKQLSELLKISQRQLSRNLKRWHYENILDYHSGNGRGHKTTIVWNINIEELYYCEVKKLLKEDKIKEALPYLTWNWSSSVKQELIKKVTNQLGHKIIDDKEKLTITKRFKIFTDVPYEALDAKSVSVLSSVYDRLFEIDENEIIHNKLAHYYELNKNYLDIYLRPNIQFHDGSFLESIDVITCLEYARNHYNTEDTLSPVTGIEKLGKLSLRVHFNYFPDIIQVLNYLEFSIYKRKDSELVGSGSYFIKENTEYVTTLERFQNYYGYSSFIDTIELINIPENRYMTIGNIDKNHSIIKRTLGFHYLCKTYHSDLSREQVRYIQYILEENYRFELNKEFKVSLDRPKILKKSKYPVVSEITKPHFIRPVIISCIGKDDVRYVLLKYILAKHDVPVDLKYIEFDRNTNRLDYEESDYLCFGEYLEIPETSSYYHFVFNQRSSIHSIIKKYPWYETFKGYYLKTSYEQWGKLNLLIDRRLYKEGILYPIYNNDMTLTIDKTLNGIKINAMGFIDFAEIWKKD